LFISVVNENVSLVISRQLLSDFCSHLAKLPDALAKEVAHFTLEKVHTRVISFEEQVCKFVYQIHKEAMMFFMSLVKCIAKTIITHFFQSVQKTTIPKPQSSKNSKKVTLLKIYLSPLKL